ncbi:TSUP family transporter [Streptomyces sp. NPDC053069]|uniref:TSUP family transporter n=1 Tax=Streptomyces sp. NPDC053069 TaxID=3365695 RepID=UPI0037D06DAE
MNDLALLGIGLLTGVTTVLFGFGGGFVAVPVVVWANAALGADAIRVATATSALVMLVNAGFATAVTPRRVLSALRGSGTLLLLLAAGATAGALATRHAPAGQAHWGFVAYVAVTIVDLLLRPGFLRRRGPAEESGEAQAEQTRTGQAGAVRAVPRALPAVLGAPIGAVAAFLGVGGSVMTVPALRRAGHPMRVATALANPLTLAIALPATALSLTGTDTGSVAGHTPLHLVGLVDLRAAGALLVGALPVIAVLRRRPPRIPDRTYAWAYLALLGVVEFAMLCAG